MTGIVGIECDGCGTSCTFRHRFGTASIMTVREYARTKGWHAIREEAVGLRDRWGTCWSRGQR